MEMNIQEGKLIWNLDYSVEYSSKGEQKKAKEVVLYEPNKAAAYDALALSQIIKQAQKCALKDFDFSSQNAEANEVAGEEVIPFFRRKQPEEKELLDEVDGLRELIMMSDVDAGRYVRAGEKILTKKYGGIGKQNLAVVDEENKVPLTKVMFSEMEMTDRLNLVTAYAVFFGISLTGTRKPMSG